MVIGLTMRQWHRDLYTRKGSSFKGRNYRYFWSFGQTNAGTGRQ